METTANNIQESSHSMRSSIISKLRRTGLILAMAALLCDLSGLSRVQAQSTFTASSLAIFSNKDGALPWAGLIAYNGNLYGTTANGGSNGCCGTIFEVSPNGGFPTTLWNFKGTSTDGGHPFGTLLQLNGKFYGTTSQGGTCGCGTVFVFTPPVTNGGQGKLTIMHSFRVTDGNDPIAGLTKGSDGFLYGTTMQGGAHNSGTMFRISPTYPYPLTVLYSFCSKANCTDGQFPYAAVIQHTNGNFYGTTNTGGSNGEGTIFKYTPGKSGAIGTLSKVYDFNDIEGTFPFAGLVETGSGSLYGTTSSAGLNNGQLNGEGTIFEFYPSDGFLTIAHVFPGGSTQGMNPMGGLVEYNGNFYGTTLNGGTHGYGTVFLLDPSSQDDVQTLVNFDGNIGEGDSIVGSLPVAGLLQYKGNFYGTTYRGGPSNVGTVFKIVAQ
jgi:uncharacterized repeat protein (TIGR03803 family)